MNVKIKFLIISVLIFFCGFSNVTDKYIDINVSGEVLKALDIAYGEFDNIIYEKTVKKSEFSVFLSRIENYSVSVKETRVNFFIKFSPKPFNGKTVFGGASEYTIDKVSYRVLNIKHTE